MATVVIPASHGMPEATLHLSNEGTLADRWKIDVPDTLSAQQLRSNLEQQLSQLGDKNSWPSDVNDAYRMVTHHVLLAISEPQSDMNGRNDTGGRSDRSGQSNTSGTGSNTPPVGGP